MKKVFKILVILVILLAIIAALVFTLCFKEKEVNDKIPYKDITYAIPLDTYCSCLILGDDNHYSEYDCESEPSNMPFSKEFYSKFYYNKEKQTLTFKGKKQKDVKVSILNWTEDEFKIKVLNTKVKNTSCSSNKKDTFTYYKKEEIMNGSNIKTFVNDYANKELKIEFWDESLYTNYRDKECDDCKVVKTNKLLDRMKDDSEYTIEYNRDKNGKIIKIRVN